MIQGIYSNDPIYGNSPSAPTQELGRDAFMSLLVEQMRNQDPLQPTSNDQFIAQLAQFSSLEEMQGVNENLVALAMLQQGNALMEQLTNSSVLIGKSVEYLDPTSGEEAIGQVDSVKIVEGVAVLQIDGQEVPLANVTGVTGESAGQAGEDSEDDSGAA